VAERFGERVSANSGHGITEKVDEALSKIYALTRADIARSGHDFPPGSKTHGLRHNKRTIYVRTGEQ
jgi:hypothetical protein